jgi:hypothetical protein
MNTQKNVLVLMMLVLGILMAACAQAAPREPAVVTEAVQVVEVVETIQVEVARPTQAPVIVGTAVPQPPPHDAQGRARLIIKDAQVKLLVDDTDIAIDRTTQMVSDLGGYIISSRIWYQQTGETNYKFATLTLGVPVDRFEQALRRLRDLAIRVLDENASGQDVTDEYVDLESRLKNLQATRDRIREFLDQAKTVEEALKVNEQLASVEAEIEQVQGRMNYLFDRAAFSTITVDIEPEITIPTPTPTPTRTPTPTPTAWSPAVTFREAGGSLRDVSVALTQAAIWILVLVVPLLLPPALVLWLIWYLVRGRKKAPRKEIQEPVRPQAGPS